MTKCTVLGPFVIKQCEHKLDLSGQFIFFCFPCCRPHRADLTSEDRFKPKSHYFSKASSFWVFKPQLDFCHRQCMHTHTYRYMYINVQLAISVFPSGTLPTLSPFPTVFPELSLWLRHTDSWGRCTCRRILSRANKSISAAFWSSQVCLKNMYVCLLVRALGNVLWSGQATEHNMLDMPLRGQCVNIPSMCVCTSLANHLQGILWKLWIH